MASVYPAGPRSVPPDLAKPSRAYAFHAAMCTLVLLLFVAAYLAATAWLGYKAYRLLSSASPSMWVWLAGGCAAFLTLFMVKGLFFIKKGAYSGDVEIKAKDEPALLEFIHRLADEAGAPRPARVFLSPRVNAAVFYDISVLNLLFPTRKGLEIGLGLVNVLTLDELKAVLAHEFGHFGQRTMLIGRWVYMAQQIAAHIVAKRDALDRFLEKLAHFDVRVAWVAWILSLVVWAIRSLTDSAFRVLVLAQRALSREMEMQADLVAVSLTGSDALVHALHRMAAAEDAWDRALAFARGELARGKTTLDLYDIQSRIIERLRAILDEPHFGRPPRRPEQEPGSHRLFGSELAEPSRMWATHPSNRDREENAKRVYVAAELSNTSAWVLFANPGRVRERTTAQVLKANGTPPAAVSREDSLLALNAQFEREAFKRFYRGAYILRSLTRYARRTAELYGAANAGCLGDLPKLYPDQLGAKLKQLRAVVKDLAALEAIRDGFLKPTAGIIRHRGRAIGRRALGTAIQELRAERDALHAYIEAHDRMCRTAHVAAAHELGHGWKPYLTGLLDLIHYAEHTSANLYDLVRVLDNVVAVEAATGKVGKAAMSRILGAAGAVQAALETVFTEAPAIQLGAGVAERLGYAAWKAHLGSLTLVPPTRENINDWLAKGRDWVGAVCAGLDRVAGAALDELLVSEARVARAWTAKEAVPDAPAVPRVPAEYAVLPTSTERKLQQRFGWWARFQRADGLPAEASRFAVAAVIVGAVVTASGDLGKSTIHVHNGLARPVLVSLGARSIPVAEHGLANLDVEPGERYSVRTVTRDGHQIESFETSIENARDRVYNIASASPLVEWTAVYGQAIAVPPRWIGAKRWGETGADYVFTEPPTSISTKGSGSTRTVLSDAGSGDPGLIPMSKLAQAERGAMILAHVRWDATSSRHIMAWLDRAMDQPGLRPVLAARLGEEPLDPALLRVEQDLAQGEARAAVCERDKALAAQHPTSADLRYIVARCEATPDARDLAFVEGYRAAPGHPWLAMAAGYTYAERMQWTEAAEAFEHATSSAALRGRIDLDLVRIKRVMAADASTAMARAAADSERNKELFALERRGPVSEELRPYSELAAGKIAAALRSPGQQPEERARLLRLAAASDGADAALVAKALALKPEEGLDGETLWTSWALTYREGRETAAYRQLAAKAADEEHAAQLQQFLDATRDPGRAEEAERFLHHLPPALLGQAYAMGVVVLGPKAPVKWRDGAKRLLFVFERPYFA